MEQSAHFRFDDCEIDGACRSLLRSGRSVEIEPRAFDLLVYLIEHRERVVSCEELLHAVWCDVAVTPSALSRAVYKVRHALGDDGGSQRVIETARGHGFRFVAPIYDDDMGCGVASTGAAGPSLETALRALIEAATASRLPPACGARPPCVARGEQRTSQPPCLALLHVLAGLFAGY